MVDGSLRNANVLTLSLQLFEDIPDVSTPFVVKIRVMNYDVDPVLQITEARAQNSKNGLATRALRARARANS
jgi:hypothetical protein